jgi:hypothetical protein
MNTQQQQQAYINGFVKRASEYGISQDKAIELLKQAGPNLAPGVQDPQGFLDPSVNQFPQRAIPVTKPATSLAGTTAMRYIPGTPDFEIYTKHMLNQAGQQKFPDNISLRK